MKKEMVDNMTNKYGNVTVGIHGSELPKFKEVQLSTGKEWWKNAKSFTASPKNRSLVKMNQERKWWAKNDIMKIADTDAEHTPNIDVFKQVHIPKNLKNQVVEKIQNITHWKPTEADVAGPQYEPLKKTKKGWTQSESQKRCEGQDRLFDKIVKQAKMMDHAENQLEERRQKNKVEKEDYSRQMKEKSVFIG